MISNILTGAIAWLLPGVGHIKQGRMKRGLILAVIIWTMFIIGILSGGANYPGWSSKDAFLLVLLHGVATFGNGLGYFVTMIFQATPVKDIAAWSTFEYGGKFLEAAGLLNFLAVIDSFDIFYGRKK
jgi:hypothetical protein